MKKSGLVICLLALALQPSTVMAAKEHPAAKAVALPKPAPGKGQIVIFRPTSDGFETKCTVRENRAMIGRVGPKRYYVVEVEPGVHQLTAKTEKTDAVAIVVEPDEASYVRCGITMGIMVGRPNLSPSTEEEFNKSAAKLKPMEAEKIAAEIEKDKAELASKGASN